MAAQDPEVRLSESYAPQVRGGSVQIALDPEAFRNCGVEPLEEPEKIPDRLTQEFIKQGRREGIIVIDLQGQIEDHNDGEE